MLPTNSPISLKELPSEIQMRGMGISPGIAIGTTVRIDDRGHKAELIHIKESQIEREVRRLKRSVAVARRQLKLLKERMERELGKDHAYILDAHILMLQDQALFKSVEQTISQQLVNAEWAIKLELDRFLAAYASISDGYLRQRGSDIEDVAHRLIDALSGRRKADRSKLRAHSIVVADELPPSVLAELDIEHLIGLATHAGGWASHTAIIAKSLRIPAVIGLEHRPEQLSTGCQAIIDGTEGLIILNPSEPTLQHYKSLCEHRRKSFSSLIEQSHIPAKTSDGEEIKLRANIELLSELDAVQRFGAQGIGLFRSEYIFTNMLPQACSEEGQTELYTRLSEVAEDYGVAIRTFDLSQDRLPLTRKAVEENPAMGLRGIRLALKAEDMFRTQIRAILKASKRRNIRITLPLISCLSELRQARRLINDTIKELLDEGLDIDSKISVGIMIEVPSAVIMIDHLIKEVDFISIGTNDLVQYLMAADRTNKDISYLYQPLHPAVLRSLARIAETAISIGKPVEVCGEMAANPIYAAVLIGLGFTRLSMTPAAIPIIKDAVRSIEISAVKEIVKKAKDFYTIREIEEFLVEELGSRFSSFYTGINWRYVN
ncbi:MAG: phosphoenolpyruvate--protein phosphotransferase [Blastocatellia bacterium]|nr:phosphoenolpyruvate--protein phosphotransferase [Blastocatellia bacterium]